MIKTTFKDVVTVAATSEWLCLNGSVSCNSSIPGNQGAPRGMKEVGSVGTKCVKEISRPQKEKFVVVSSQVSVLRVELT